MPRVKPKAKEVAEDHRRHWEEEGPGPGEAVEEGHVKHGSNGAAGHGDEEGDPEMLRE